MTVSRNEAQRLSKDAAEIGARMVRGVLKVGTDGAKVGQTDLLAWLAKDAGSDVMLIALPLGARLGQDEVKICYTCGRNYTGEACPHCTEARARLRGG
jgi:hypothetical protein